MKLRSALVLVAGVALFAPNVWAFPSNVRYGYPNCTACHISPTGGGVLSAYGRELSLEVLSSKGTEKEAAFAYGLVKTPDWLDAGGDVRYLEMIQDTPTALIGTGFWMQADAEAAVHIGKMTIDGTFGWKGDSEALASDTTFLSRRHYAMVSLNDQMSVRVGRFYPMFGLMQPEHEDATRMGLGFDEGEESYNVEFAYQNENGSFFFSPILGKLRGGSLADEKGFAFSKFFIVGGNSRLGLSGLYGKEIDQSAFDHRFVLGPNAILKISKPVFWLAEADLEDRVIDGGTHQSGLYEYQKLSYEPVQGLIVSARQDLERTVVSDPLTSVVTLGPVIDWYPRPHLDLQGTMCRVFVPEGSPNSWTYTGMLHFYM